VHGFLLRLLSGALTLGLIVSLSVAFDRPQAAHAALPSQTVYDTGLHEMGRWVGQYAFSADGFGDGTDGAGNLQVDKPVGATTVQAAYLTMVSKFLIDPDDPTATLLGSNVTFTHRTGGVAENQWQNWLSDVTSLVSGTLNTASAGGSPIDISVTYDYVDYTGVALTVIWNSTTAEAGTTMFQFGHADTTAETTRIDFASLSGSTTGALLSLGIGWSAAYTIDEVSTVDIETTSSRVQRLTAFAGSPDDSSGTNSFITVGGVGDSPQTSAPANAAADNELYSLDRFLGAGDTFITLETANPTGNDSVFQLVLYVPGVLATEAVTFAANGGSGSMATQASSSATALSSNSFERSGYSFAGWNTAADGSGTSYTNNATYAFVASVTLFAQWSLSPSSASAASTGIFLYLAGRPGSSVEGCPVYYGSVSIKPNTTYILSIQSVTNPALTRTVLAKETTNDWGHADQRLEMGKLAAGTYKVVMTGTHRLDYPLVLTNYISVDRNGNFISLSPESLQPTLS